MDIKKKCDKIWSLLGDLSSTGIKPIPDLVLEMRTTLEKIERAAEEPKVTRPCWWIPVEKAMPEESADVLTYSAEVGCAVLMHYHGEWWRSMDGIWAFEVLYWMPLPEEPK